jgi:multidrug efflux pump subunit AcrA (membrane-fusion protein)
MKLSADGKRKTAREERVPAFMQLGNETGFPHEGYIDFVDNRIDPGTGTMRARAVFKAWNWLLTPGFFVRLRVPGAPPAIVTLVDDKVISSEQGQKFVFVVKADNTLERRTIVTGAMNEGLRIVREGLGAGEKVVSARLMILMPDMSVQPIPEPARSTQVAK